MKKHIRIPAVLILILLSFVKIKGQDSLKKEIVIHTDNIITKGYTGSGAQWGGYHSMSAFTGRKGFLKEDWKKLTERIDFMRPGFMRIMGTWGWNYELNGSFKTGKNIVLPVFEYCQKRGITMAYGEWKHRGGDAGPDSLWMETAVNYLSWLVNKKGFNCIKYYTIINEPNGYWSSAKENFDLWSKVVTRGATLMKMKGLSGKVELMGPDIAYWNAKSAIEFQPWIDKTATLLSDVITAYDLHAYPGQEFVRSGKFGEALKKQIASLPEGRKIFMTELGGKYPDEPLLDRENKRRKMLDPGTSEDMNMFTYDAFYAIDMADALIQCINSGLNGAAFWDMDDAMYIKYDKGKPTKEFHRWGFWNILGKEAHNNPADEAIRPWFYTISLLCRYIPAGSDILRCSSPESIKVVSASKNGCYTVALLNSGEKETRVTVRFSKGQIFKQFKRYYFRAGELSTFEGRVTSGGLPLPIEENLQIDFTKGYDVNLPPLSFILITNID